MRQSEVRIGVVGTGSWSAIAHIPAVLANPRAVLAGIADLNADRLSRAGEHFRIAARFSDHDELIHAGALDALVIATPHATHYAIARDALDAGLHVLIEKPFTVRAEDAHDLMARADDRGLTIVVGYTAQFGPAGIRSREVVRRGELGEITLMSTLFTSNLEDFLLGQRGADEAEVARISPVGGPSQDTYSDALLSGGGQGQSQVTHAIGMQLHVSGLRPTRVSAFMAKRQAAVDLVDTINYELAGGALGSAVATGALGPREMCRQELHYFGTQGSLVHNFVTGALTLFPRDGGPPRLECPALTAQEEASLRAEPVNCLIDLLHDEGINRGPASAATSAVELLDAAYRSAERGAAPVSIDERLP